MKILFPIEQEWLNEIMTVVAACLTPAVVFGAWEAAKAAGRTATLEDLTEARTLAVDQWLHTMNEIAGRFHVRPPALTE